MPVKEDCARGLPIFIRSLTRPNLLIGLGKPVQTVRVDMKGFLYQFTGISQGNYVIKVAPDSGSEAIRNFLPSFYDQNSEEKKANLVRIGKEDPTIDIHLQPK